MLNGDLYLLNNLFMRKEFKKFHTSISLINGLSNKQLYILTKIKECIIVNCKIYFLIEFQVNEWNMRSRT
jgi:hypothetical protein